MTKYELSISANYVENWGKVEAIRELFQNALDEQVKDTNNTMFFDYDENSEILRIGNKNSTLKIQTLLIGNTTKNDNSKKFIGQHGEGYKLATIVLLRENCNIIFYNYNTREIWTTRLVKSRKYKGALVPTFYVENVPFWTPIPSNSLVIAIHGITADDYIKIKGSNLNLQADIECKETSYGRILLNEKYKGNVYVSGLFVCKNNTISYGYDVKPEYIRLDRDRRLVGDVDLHWITSRIIGETNDTELIKKCIKMNDGRFLQYNIKNDIVEEVAESFFERYGVNAVPVSDNSEFNKYINNGYTAIMVTESEQSVIRSSDRYIEPQNKESLLYKIKIWYDTIEQLITQTSRDEFEVLLEEMEDKFK